MPTDKQRRAAERRRLRRQLQRRAERDARRRRFAVIASILGTLTLAGLIVGLILATSGNSSNNAAGGHKTTSSSPAASPSSSASTSAAAAYPCSWTKSGTAAKQAHIPSTTRPKKTGKVAVSVRTTQGQMTFTLNRRAAPCAVASFVSLVQQHYYDSTPCHRLVTQGIYVLQCGDPTGTGSGGPGYKFNDELTGKEKYTRGVLAMANSGADTNGSQFFIVYKDSLSLPASYTIFGTVTKGMNVVDKVAAKGSDNSNGTGDGKPKLPIKLTKLQVAK